MPLFASFLWIQRFIFKLTYSEIDFVNNLGIYIFKDSLE